MLSQRAQGNVKLFMPIVAAKLEQRHSADVQKIDLATAENWLMRDEILPILENSVFKELTASVCLSSKLSSLS